MPARKASGYDLSVDFLRVISILAVISIHTTTTTLVASSFDLLRFPWTLFLNQISRFAVPLFFMISGFVLELNYSHHSSYFSYLYRRLNKIVIPFTVWSAIYYFFIYREHGMGFFQAWYTGSASYQLYFIPALMLFYIFFPVIHYLYRFLSSGYVLVFLGAIQLWMLQLEYTGHHMQFNYSVNICLLNFYVFLIGVVASHHQDQIRKFLGRYKYLVLAAVCSLGYYVFSEGRSGYLQTHNYLSFYSQWRPSNFLYTISIAAAGFYFFFRSDRFKAVIHTLSSLSFFVFFVHLIFLELLLTHLVRPYFFSDGARLAQEIWFDPLFFGIVAALSFGVAYLAHRIPLLARILG